jgi:hypothetical protein
MLAQCHIRDRDLLTNTTDQVFPSSLHFSLSARIGVGAFAFKHQDGYL